MKQIDIFEQRKKRFIEEQKEKCSLVPSVHFELISGNIVTTKRGVLLGGELENDPYSKASWSVLIPRKHLNNITSCFFVICGNPVESGIRLINYNMDLKLIVNKEVIGDFISLSPFPSTESWHPPKDDYFLPNNFCPFTNEDINKYQGCYFVHINDSLINNTEEQELQIEVGNNVSIEFNAIGIAYDMKMEYLASIMNGRTEVFISHNSKDKEIARRLSGDLSMLGCDTWIDEAEIRVGDSLIEKIREGIDKVEYLVVLLSKSSIESEWVKKEVEIAMNQEIENKSVKVIPVLLDNIDLPWFLKGKLYADLRDLNNYSKVLDQMKARFLEV